MEFICLGSSSSGNAYVFKHNDDCVLVECGFKFKDMISKLHRNNIVLSEIKAVITTHEHGDHSRSVTDFAQHDVPTFCPWMSHQTCFDIIPWLSVFCFPVTHDPEITACGFVFFNKETKETILFINDTKCFELPNDLRHIPYDYIFIECNHLRNQLEVVMQKAMDEHDQGHYVKFKRQAQCHLGLAGTKKMLRMMNLSKVKGIFLMHLSKDVSNKVVMKEEVATVFGKATFVCEREGGFF